MEILIATIIVCICVLFLYLKQKPLKGKLIPGPKGLPLIGCAKEVTAVNIHHKMIEYALQYGDIVQFKIFGKNYVSLNTAEYIRKAFCDDPYKQCLSDRPEYALGKYIFKGSQSIALSLNGNGQTHNDLRKGFIKGLRVFGEGVREFEITVIGAIQDMIQNVENYKGQEFDFMMEINIVLSKIIAILLNGETIGNDADDIQLFDDYNKSVNRLANPKINAILMALPFLRKVPGFYKKSFEAVLNADENLQRKYFYKTKVTYQPGQIRGIVDYMIQEQKKDMDSGNDVIFTDIRIRNVVKETVAAGFLTSYATLANMMLCLLHHPQYQTRMQQEIDDVVGRNRQPSIEHRARCPFIEAVAMETLRYMTLGPVLVPHQCNSNIAFEGYDVPENTTIFPNVHFVHHDEKVWGDPWSFRPERFLGEDGQLLPRGHVLRKNWLPFGTGRRQCIGESLARSRLFLVISSLLQRWNFVPSPDKCGSCDPRADDMQISGTVMHVKPFFCSVKERS